MTESLTNANRRSIVIKLNCHLCRHFTTKKNQCARDINKPADVLIERSFLGEQYCGPKAKHFIPINKG